MNRGVGEKEQQQQQSLREKEREKKMGSRVRTIEHVKEGLGDNLEAVQLHRSSSFFLTLEFFQR